MLFNSLTFLLAFLPLGLCGYYGAARLGSAAAKTWLVAASLLFYAWWNPYFVLLLTASIAFNFTLGRLIFRCSSRERVQMILLSLGIAANLSALCYYKYLFPLLNWLDAHGLPLPEHAGGVALPLGISFFTFTQLGYLADARAGVAKRKNFLDYALFVTFFPHLIAGPILHHREMMPQFADPHIYRFQARHFAVGIAIFCIGLAKKVLIADALAPVAGGVFDHANDAALLQAWSGLLSYSLQLYFDFSGYSDMAVGLALMFNIRFPANFDSPYKSTSVIEFWQRWHITLTRYLTLYVYNPVALRITRRRAARGKSIARKAVASPSGFVSMVAVPTCFTMLLAGIWHGAGLQFLVFGMLHAAYLCINHAWRAFRPKRDARPRAWAVGSSVLLTLLAVLLAQLFFRASSMENAVQMLKAMAGAGGVLHRGDFYTPRGPLEILAEWCGFDWHDWLDKMGVSNPVTLAAGWIFVWALPNVLQLFAAYAPTLSEPRSGASRLQWRPTLCWAIALGALAAACVLSLNGTTEFLYFKF